MQIIHIQAILIISITPLFLKKFYFRLAITQSILAKAFCGELFSKDPNDLFASVLIERIRAEKEKQGLNRKKNVKIKQK